MGGGGKERTNTPLSIPAYAPAGQSAVTLCG